jgi:Tol biopolymer transport system component
VTGPPTMLSPGTRLGDYEILGSIASGGMGEVYRARDTRLDREVALKVVGRTHAIDSSAMTRFEREAKALASLSHPHVLSIFQLGREGDVTYFVTELLKGETLREKLRHGPLPLETALRLAQEVAEGLAAAHDRGIIHRDLKPGNVFITDEGHAKILDFSLVRLEEPATVGSSQEEPTEERLTRTGAVLGTVGYMSPEQARGQKVDVRTDVFGLGILLYEMLAGARPFAGPSDADILAAILNMEPPSLEKVSRVPPEVARVVKRCLMKDPAARYPSAREAAKAIEACRSLRGSSVGAILLTRRWVRWAIFGMGVVLAAYTVGALWIQWGRERNRLPPFESRQVTSRPGAETDPAVSPDGTAVVYVAKGERGDDLWVQDTRGGPPLRLTGDGAGNGSPSWYPDGSAVAFTSHRDEETAVWKISRFGGAPVRVLGDAAEPAISPDARRIAFTRADKGGLPRIWVAPLGSPGDAKRLTGDGDGTWVHGHPAWSPDGKTLCYQDWNDLWLVPAEGGQARRLTHDDPQDQDPVWSRDGRFIYFDSFREGQYSLWRVAVKDGKVERVTLGTGAERFPSLSKDGKRLVYATTGKIETLLVDRTTGEVTTLPVGPMSIVPCLSPDGSSFVTDSTQGGSPNLWRIRLADGKPKGEPERLTETEGNCANVAYSPDSRWLAYHRVLQGRRDVWVVPAAGGPPVNFTDDPAMDAQPQWTPDGKAISFISDRGNSWGIWVAPFRDGRRTGEPRCLVSGFADISRHCWLPGNRLALAGSKPRDSEVWLVPADGSAPAKQLTQGAEAWCVCWDARTSTLMVQGLWGGTTQTLRTVPLDGEPPVPFADAKALPPDMAVMVSALSADGRFLAVSGQKQEGDVWMLQAAKGMF